jgi:stage V sporulation protein R
MEYEQIKKSYTYGLSKIYEMVINNDPCYAYLLEGNSLVDQKIVMAHVFAHCDFFKNNCYFSPTHRNMMNKMANHATRVRRYMASHNVDEVENFIDLCLTIENLIDIHAPMLQRDKTTRSPDQADPEKGEDIGRLPVGRSYLNSYINPESYLDAQREKLKGKQADNRFPQHPQRDVLLFLMENAPLKRYQRDLLGILREEAYYFSPQGQTKIMNEGWATFWHSTIMTQKALNDTEIIDFADSHSATLGGGSRALNPYKLGLELFRHIEDRWNKGRFGKEYLELSDRSRKRTWDKQLNLGRQRIFEVRRLYNDVTFIDEFLDEDFCREKKLFGFDFNTRSGNYEISTRDFKKIKQKLLFSLTNFGQPVIQVVDANHANRSELLLEHVSEGIDLDLAWARPTMESLFRLWTRPVLVKSRVEDKPTILRFDGEKHSTEGISES